MSAGGGNHLISVHPDELRFQCMIVSPSLFVAMPLNFFFFSLSILAL